MGGEHAGETGVGGGQRGGEPARVDRSAKCFIEVARRAGVGRSARRRVGKRSVGHSINRKSCNHKEHQEHRVTELRMAHGVDWSAHWETHHQVFAVLRG